MARASRFPDDGADLVRAVRDLQRTVRELAAAPRGSNTAISSGGLTLVGASGQRISLTPTSPLGITLPDGSVIYPPAAALLSAIADTAAGALTTYREPTAGGSVPVAALISPQAGPTTSSLTLRGGEDAGVTARALLAAAGATLALTPDGLTITLAGGAALTFTAAGIRLTGTTFAPVFLDDAATQTSSATAFTDLPAGAFSGAITVPPSGRVMVEIQCTQRAVAGVNAITSFRAVGSVSGTVYTETTNPALIVAGATNVILGYRRPLSGLTAGETLTVTTKHRLSTTGTQTVDYRSILLEPAAA